MLRSYYLKIEINGLKSYGSLEAGLKGRGELNWDNYLVIWGKIKVHLSESQNINAKV